MTQMLAEFLRDSAQHSRWLRTAGLGETGRILQPPAPAQASSIAADMFGVNFIKTHIGNAVLQYHLLNHIIAIYTL